MKTKFITIAPAHKFLLSTAYIILCTGFFIPYLCAGQNIAVNTTGAAGNSSALLDVGNGSPATGGDSKGMLIPRVALTSATDGTTIASPQTSLIVWNSGTGGLTPAGYYYNSGTSGSPVWTQLLSTSSSSGLCAPTQVTNEINAVNGAPCTGASCTGAAMTPRNCWITCDNLVYNGYSDWRTPTIEELSSLVNITPNNTNTNYIWSSTPYFGKFGDWVVFQESTGYWNNDSYTYTYFCRCVR